MPDMYITPKPEHLMISDGHGSAKELLESLIKLPNSKSVAVVIGDGEGNFSTYQFGCNGYELECCASALTEWAKDIDIDYPIAKNN